MSPRSSWGILAEDTETSKHGGHTIPEMTRGAGRGRRLALLGEEISLLAGLPAESHVGKQASFAQIAKSTLFSCIEYDRALRPIQDVGNEAVVARVLCAVGAAGAVDHQSAVVLCAHGISSWANRRTGV